MADRRLPAEERRRHIADARACGRRLVVLGTLSAVAKLGDLAGGTTVADRRWSVAAPLFPEVPS